MDNITDIVREKYAEAARRVARGAAATCGCGTATRSAPPPRSATARLAGTVRESGPSSQRWPVGSPSDPTFGEGGCCDPITSNLYGDADVAAVPDTALKASLGCGNPTALAQLNPGETVLDLLAAEAAWTSS